MKNLLALKNIVLIGFVLIVVVIFAVIKIPQDNTPVSPTPKTNEQSAPPPFVAAAGPSPSSTAPTALKSKTQTAPAPATLPNTPQADTTDDCGSNFDCYQAYYQNQVKAFGVVAAFDKLKEQYPQNAYVQSQCHPLTHVIGQSAILLYESVSQAFSNGDGFCWSGYYHGVMEGVVGKVGRNNFLGGLNTYCSDITGKASYSFDYFNCVHGLGHGVMAYSNNELFESLRLCDGLTGSWEQSSCQGGVFMENVIIDNKNHFTKYLKPDDLLYPCNAVDIKYKGQCYLMQTSYMLKKNGSNFTATFDLCSKADEGFQTTCWQSLGRDVSSRNYSNVAGIKTTCGLGANFDQQANCLIGAVKDVISYFHSDVQATELCGLYEGDLKNVCNSTATSYYKNF